MGNKSSAQPQSLLNAAQAAAPPVNQAPRVPGKERNHSLGKISSLEVVKAKKKTASWKVASGRSDGRNGYVFGDLTRSLILGNRHSKAALTHATGRAIRFGRVGPRVIKAAILFKRGLKSGPRQRYLLYVLRFALWRGFLGPVGLCYSGTASKGWSSLASHNVVWSHIVERSPVIGITIVAAGTNRAEATGQDVESTMSIKQVYRHFVVKRVCTRAKCGKSFTLATNGAMKCRGHDGPITRSATKDFLIQKMYKQRFSYQIFQCCGKTDEFQRRRQLPHYPLCKRTHQGHTETPPHVLSGSEQAAASAKVLAGSVARVPINIAKVGGAGVVTIITAGVTIAFTPLIAVGAGAGICTGRVKGMAAGAFVGGIPAMGVAFVGGSTAKAIMEL